MPNENPPPSSFFAGIETVIHALSLYGAAGIAAFGWAMGRFMDLPTAAWLPLWFCAALLIYNADRLRRDPADALNLPLRTAASTRLRTASAVTLTLASLLLVGLPVWRCEWGVLACVLGGAVFSLGYSFPVFSFRWKDLPLVKTLFAPTIITVSIFVLILHDQNLFGPRAEFLNSSVLHYSFPHLVGFLIPWALFYLLFNMLLCDLRDRAGDAQCGVRSIPVVWGEKGARRLLWALVCAGQLCLSILINVRRETTPAFALLSLLTGSYQAYLLHATRRPCSERFYEWAVEGLLYLPALACGTAHLLSRLDPGGP